MALTPLGKEIKKRLIDLDKEQKWLVERVSNRTGRYFDDSHLWKICNGVLSTPDVVQVICDILDISVPEQQTEKQDSKEVK